MDKKIKMEDIQKLQETIEKMQNIIGETIQEKEEFTTIINKPAKELTDKDIESIKDLRKKVEQLDEIYNRNSKAYYIEEKVKLIEEKIEKYSLVDVDDLEIEEEKGYLEQAKDLIEQIKSISGKQTNLSDLSQKLAKKIDMQKIEKRKEEIKDDFLATQENSSCIIMIYGDKEKVISDKERKLMENGLLLTPIYATPFDYGPHGDWTGREVKHYGYDELKFIDYSEATTEQKQKIREKEKKISDIKESTDKEYDKKGKISIPIEMKKRYYTSSGEEIKPRLSVTLETTQRELANAGIDPQDFDFKRMKKKSLVNSEQIARLDENMALTTTEVGRIKGFFSRLKEFFKGKGEK